MKNKKIIVIIVVISNLLFVWSVYRMFYKKNDFYDSTKRAVIDSNKISEIKSAEGTWKWNNMIYDFYKSYKLTCINKEEINGFCQIVKSSKSINTQMAGCDYWINIYFEKKGKRELAIVLKHNYSNQVFFEYQDKKYDGKPLADYIQNRKVKTQ